MANGGVGEPICEISHQEADEIFANRKGAPEAASRNVNARGLFGFGTKAWFFEGYNRWHEMGMDLDQRWLDETEYQRLRNG